MQNSIIKYGIIYAIISLILALINVYIFQLGTMLQLMIGIVATFFLAKALTDELKQNTDGIMPYGDAFKNIFFFLTIGSIIYYVVFAVFVNYIDPSVKETLFDQAMESAKSMLTMFGGSEEMMEAAKEDMEASLEGKFEFGKMLIDMWVLPIGTAILAAIVAIFFKKSDDFNTKHL
jgi:Protein of unknown function (DUF4199)